ncbi:MAG: SWIM zinc finger domain-containing protein [Haloplanus sp.]
MDRERAITEATVRRLARSQSFERGEQYYEENTVSDIIERGSTLRAEVEGSQPDPYQVTIELGETDINDTYCSCPYDHGGICKHRVAVLLTYLRDPDAVTHRPTAEELLADCDRDTLHTVLIKLLDDHPELVTDVEQYLLTMTDQQIASDTATDTAAGHHHPPDPDDARQRVREILDFSNARGASDPRADMEDRVDDLSNLTDDAWALIEAGEGEEALAVLEAIAEELMGDEWLQLSYDDSNRIFDILDELSTAFTEALLIADLSEDRRDDWADRLDNWADELAGYTPQPPFRAAAAATRAWTHDGLQAILDETTEDSRLWEGDRPWYADDLTTARLTVLDREDRTEEYLRLAEADGQTDAYATKLLEIGRVDDAIEHALTHASTPAEAITIAQALQENGRPDAAIRVADRGLSQDGPRKAELAAWLRDVAIEHDDEEAAMEAAVTTFKSDPSLTAYQAAEEVTPEPDWPSVRDDLLDYLATQSPGRSTAHAHVEIFLYEDRIDDAIAVAEQVGHDSVLERVVSEVWEDRPDWAIDVCKEQAEPIIENGQSDRYQEAVDWLETAGRAAQTAGKLDDWHDHIDTLRDRHSQKYKLAPMLDELCDEF